jgi:hypothetical protein
LRAQLVAWAPFDDAEFRVEWQDAAALAVAWDRGTVQALLTQAGVSADVIVEPELWLREPMTADGVRLIEGLEGIDAQWWRDGRLHAARWWPERPTASEFAAWLRSLGAEAPVLDGLPPTTNPAWRARAEGERLALDDLSSTTSRIERLAIGAAGLVLVAFTAAQAQQLYGAYTRSRDVAAELERARLTAAPTLAARERALSMAQEAQALATALTAVAPLDVLQHLAEVLPPTALLREFDSSGSKFRVSLELPPATARSAVVREMQAAGWFTRVTEAPDPGSRGWTLFDVELAGLRPPAEPRALRPGEGAAARSPAPAASPFAATAPPAPAAVFPANVGAARPAPSVFAPAPPAPGAPPSPARGAAIDGSSSETPTREPRTVRRRDDGDRSRADREAAENAAQLERVRENARKQAAKP